MLPSVKGVYRNGRVELIEPPPEGSDGDVIVTFLESRSVNLADRGIDEPHAADLRHRLAAFVEDWERPKWMRMMPLSRGDVPIRCFPSPVS